jgi:hypothetical protein
MSDFFQLCAVIRKNVHHQFVLLSYVTLWKKSITWTLCTVKIVESFQSLEELFMFLYSHIILEHSYEIRRYLCCNITWLMTCLPSSSCFERHTYLSVCSFHNFELSSYKNRVWKINFHFIISWVRVNIVNGLW